MSSQHVAPTPKSVVRSFVDLRAFADQEAAPAVRARGQDPFLACRRLLSTTEGPVMVGVLQLPSGSGKVASMPADEFLIVHKGRVTLEADGRAIALAPDASVVLSRGTGIVWSADEAVTLIFLRRSGGPDDKATMVPVEEDPLLTPSGAPLAELLVGPTPSCRNYSDYRSPDGEFVCGTWDSTPYHRLAMPYRHVELMYLLDGSVTFVDGANREGTFRKGDIFLVEQGAHCSWESREYVKKVYAIYRPA
ncbi:cupin domain-containing protein [Pseudoxanthomonas wuyuanensis]